jgi:tetratricopeptide (TPR) repeat protein
MKEALDIYLNSDLADRDKIEKSLEFTNRAIELDNQNISALTHKTTLLFRKKDIDGLLQTVDELIKLRPEKPYYLVQKAVYLELNGDNSTVIEYYDSALSKYLKASQNRQSGLQFMD